MYVLQFINLFRSTVTISSEGNLVLLWLPWGCVVLFLKSFGRVLGFLQLWDPFRRNFRSHFGSCLGSKTGTGGAKRAQESQRGLQEAKNAIFEKVDFAWDSLHCFALETSQDSPKRPRRLPKGVPGELPDLKRWLPTRSPKNTNL